MTRVSKSSFRKKVIPMAAVAAVLITLYASYVTTLQSPDQSFSFGVYWPPPNAYVTSTPTPNVSLGINYTGQGLRSYTYIISHGSTVLTRGTVPINSLSPFHVVLYAPVPSELQARVYDAGGLVYSQNLSLA